MSSKDDKATGVGERRRTTRRESEIQLEVDIETRKLEGQAENISSAGVFFFSAEPLRVTVRIQDDTSSQSYVGRLVRVERLSPDTTGFAIEFDRM